MYTLLDNLHKSAPFSERQACSTIVHRSNTVALRLIKGGNKSMFILEIILPSLMTTQEAFVDSVDQDQTAQNV